MVSDKVSVVCCWGLIYNNKNWGFDIWVFTEVSKVQKNRLVSIPACCLQTIPHTRNFPKWQRCSVQQYSDAKKKGIRTQPSGHFCKTFKIASIFFLRIFLASILYAYVSVCEYVYICMLCTCIDRHKNKIYTLSQRQNKNYKTLSTFCYTVNPMGLPWWLRG